MNTKEWLSSRFVEASPFAFYRDLFPEGWLDAEGAFTPGKYTATAVQIDPQGKAKRFTLCNELSNIDELVSSDAFTVISPMSYAGKTQQAKFQRYCFGLAIDLDNLLVLDTGQPVGIESLFSQIEKARVIPKPTYVTASSANNIHLYYLFDEPIPMWKTNKEALAAYKTELTKQLWNYYVTNDYEAVQQEPIGQPMRAVGSITKDGKDRVRAFKVGDRCSVDYLNNWETIGKEYHIRIWDNPQKLPNKDKNKSRKATTVKPAFYEWFLRELPKYAREGKRYFGILCLAVVAKKSGVPFNRLENDALGLVGKLDEFTTNPDNHFTNDDAMKAIQAYDTAHFMFMRRETLVRLSGVPMNANKRNGRTQPQHMVYLNGMNKLRQSMGEPIGRPTKEKLVKDFAEKHPQMKAGQMARELGISVNTVKKWLK